MPDRLTPDDSSNGGGGNKQDGVGGRYNDYPPEPKPQGHPTPAPEPLIQDQRTVVAALNMASTYYPVGELDVLRTDGLTNESVNDYIDKRMGWWYTVPEFEDNVKPYQIWAGPMVRSGIFKFIPIFGFFVIPTGRMGVGEKQSVSLNTNVFTDGFPSSTCWGAEGGFSPAAADGLTGSVDMTYNVNFGPIGFTYVPDKSISMRIESCLTPNFNVSIGVVGSRGFSGTLNRPKVENKPAVNKTIKMQGKD